MNKDMEISYSANPALMVQLLHSDGATLARPSNNYIDILKLKIKNQSISIIF